MYLGSTGKRTVMSFSKGVRATGKKINRVGRVDFINFISIYF